MQELINQYQLNFLYIDTKENKKKELLLLNHSDREKGNSFQPFSELSDFSDLHSSEGSFIVFLFDNINKTRKTINQQTGAHNRKKRQFPIAGPRQAGCWDGRRYTDGKPNLQQIMH